MAHARFLLYETEAEKRMKLHIVFGAMCPSIQEQLVRHGIRKSKKMIQPIQMDADAIVRLNIRGILPDSSAMKARIRLLRKLIKVACSSFTL